MIHDAKRFIGLAENHHPDGSPSAVRTGAFDLGREPMVSEGACHDRLLEDPPKAANDTTANQALPDDLGGVRIALSSDGGSSFRLDQVGSDPGVIGPVRHPVRGDGIRMWKVDLCRMLNASGGGDVICDRRLRRHAARAGERFVDGRFINVPKYIAWLYDCRHAPLPRRVRNPASGNVTIQGILAALERQQFRCALTGRRLTPDEASLDHIIPISRGGQHTPENIQILHRDVNRAKSTLTNDEFVGLCRDILAHTNPI